MTLLQHDLAEVTLVRDLDVRQQSVVPVTAGPGGVEDESDPLAAQHRACRLGGRGASALHGLVGVDALGCVDADDPDRLAAVEVDADGVPVDDPRDAVEATGRRLPRSCGSGLCR
ncbi:hypothetical protein LP422_22950 [Janibacter limosus]|nr:hypothetical protein LP422_22950 [Janibacter limosus]